MKSDGINALISLEKINGVGPIKLSRLRKLGINSTKELLYHFPREYEDFRNIINIAQLTNEEISLVKIIILNTSNGTKFNSNKTTKWKVKDNTSEMEVIFFNAGFSLDKYKTGEACYLYGKAVKEKGIIKMLHPKVINLGVISDDKILPIYPATLGISQNDFRKWIKQALVCVSNLPETLPEETLIRNRICSIEYGLKNIHFPSDEIKIKEAKYRFIFEELLYLQLGLAMIKNYNCKNINGIAFTNKSDIEYAFKKLPFKLTNAQTKVINEIFKNMDKPKVMNRLIQGDVGSGKTIVAAFALLKAMANGYQAVMMAPTQLLSIQHESTMIRFFENMGYKVGLLTSSLSNKERRELLSALESGEIRLLIGTHSVIQSDVKFKNLGLVITDEQHRFGVNQRYMLSEKGESPDKIVMTATPIPRTLAMILYGDLDISVIDEIPNNRKQIVTKAFKSNERDLAYELLKLELQLGRQAFIVSPTIEENEENGLIKSATNLFMEMKDINSHLKGYRLALLHGKLKDDQKNKIMSDFKMGKIDVLISTTIIEVGIDIPNATIMLIENADCFGLSQLHQLRGRVGRGEHQSYCFLIAEAKSKISNERIATMVETTDGFLIAEKDLKLRGPGDFFGTKQHGLPELKIADLVKHIKIVSSAKAEVEIILNEDEYLVNLKNMEIKVAVNKMYRESLISTL